MKYIIVGKGDSAEFINPVHIVSLKLSKGRIKGYVTGELGKMVVEKIETSTSIELILTDGRKKYINYRDFIDAASDFIIIVQKLFGDDILTVDMLKELYDNE